MNCLRQMLISASWTACPVHSTDEREVQFNGMLDAYRWRRRTREGFEPPEWQPGRGPQETTDLVQGRPESRLRQIADVLGQPVEGFGKRRISPRPAQSRPINPLPIRQVVLSLMPAGGVVLSELLPGTRLPEVQIQVGTLPACAHRAIMEILDAQDQRMVAELASLERVS